MSRSKQPRSWLPSCYTAYEAGWNLCTRHLAGNNLAWSLSTTKEDLPRLLPRDKAWLHFSGLASFCWQCPTSTCWILSTWASSQWILTCISFLSASACTCLLLYISTAADTHQIGDYEDVHLPFTACLPPVLLLVLVCGGACRGEVVCLLLNSATTWDYKFSWNSMLSAPHLASWKQLWECKWCLDSSREQETGTRASPWLNIQLKPHLPPITRKST